MKNNDIKLSKRANATNFQVKPQNIIIRFSRPDFTIETLNFAFLCDFYNNYFEIAHNQLKPATKYLLGCNKQ